MNSTPPVVWRKKGGCRTLFKTAIHIWKCQMVNHGTRSTLWRQVTSTCRWFEHCDCKALAVTMLKPGLDKCHMDHVVRMQTRHRSNLLLLRRCTYIFIFALDINRHWHTLWVNARRFRRKSEGKQRPCGRGAYLEKRPSLGP